jgi:uncharacterized membrane protein
MPYHWLPPSGPETRLRLWPHRPLTPGGFAGFVGITAALMAVPMVALLGTPALWGVLGFAALAMAGVWAALRRSETDRSITEDLTLTPDRITLVRTGPRGRRQAWEANPHWVRAVLHPSAGPVPNYVTLQGGPREVELGAFLSEDERIALQREVQAALARLR